MLFLRLKRLLRCIEQVGSDATKLVGQTITQLDVPGNASINEASAIVENVFKFSINHFILGFH